MKKSKKITSFYRDLQHEVGYGTHCHPSAQRGVLDVHNLKTLSTVKRKSVIVMTVTLWSGEMKTLQMRNLLSILCQSKKTTALDNGKLAVSNSICAFYSNQNGHNWCSQRFLSKSKSLFLAGWFWNVKIKSIFWLTLPWVSWQWKWLGLMPGVRCKCWWPHGGTHLRMPERRWNWNDIWPQNIKITVGIDQALRWLKEIL